MNLIVEAYISNADLKSRAALPEVPLFLLYTLRACYLLMAAGLGIYVWPIVIFHTNELATAHGIRYELEAGLGATAALGVRYPVRMLPLLLFELVWKAIYLLAFACPLYVWARYVRTSGERWT